VRVFTIANATGRAYERLVLLQPDASAWPAPGLALVQATALAEAFGDVDAVLHLGPPSAMTTSYLPPALCADPAYFAMRRERMALAGVPPAQADQLLSRDCPGNAAK
jgi:hypothetical protein